jgi:hypothetical protein
MPGSRRPAEREEDLVREWVKRHGRVLLELRGVLVAVLLLAVATWLLWTFGGPEQQDALRRAWHDAVR